MRADEDRRIRLSPAIIVAGVVGAGARYALDLTWVVSLVIAYAVLGVSLGIQAVLVRRRSTGVTR